MQMPGEEAIALYARKPKRSQTAKTSEESELRATSAGARLISKDGCRWRKPLSVPTRDALTDS